MLERESNKEKNLEKALREAKIRARKEAAAKEAAEKEKQEDAEDVQEVSIWGRNCSALHKDIMLLFTIGGAALRACGLAMNLAAWAFHWADLSMAAMNALFTARLC